MFGHCRKYLENKKNLLLERAKRAEDEAPSSSGSYAVYFYYRYIRLNINPLLK